MEAHEEVKERLKKANQLLWRKHSKGYFNHSECEFTIVFWG